MTSLRAKLILAAAVLIWHPLGAQEAPKPLELGMLVGVNMRAERGHTLGGARLEGSLRNARPTEGGFEYGGALTQMVAYYGAHGEGASVKENAIEAFVRWEHRTMAIGNAQWFVSGGPVVAMSIGCTSGGSGVRDQLGYGSTDCTNNFAKTGTVRPGLAGRTTLRFTSSRASAMAGLDAALGTVAAGNAVAITPFVGLRVMLR